MSDGDDKWDISIKPKHNLLSISFEEIWRYKDLLIMFIKRDFVTLYKQTILGPIWFFIQPIFVTLIYTIVFGRLAGLSTDGLPKVLFYMSGSICWNYFADCFNKTSSVFRDNQAIFGKVYFPRLITPLSIVISGLFKLGIQLLLLLCLICFYIFFKKFNIEPNLTILLFPYLILLMASLSLGFGLIITSLTTKYRDLTFLLQFAIQLLMYATPVIYPISTIIEKYPNYKWLILANPLSSIIETFRYGVLGKGTFEPLYLGYSTIFAVFVLFFGIIIFNKTEKNFMDTI